ncbi:MAG: tripartite tricarboxylate transporter substrate binding protein [Betaproteobacteria bacterium]|nr:tripartite tricarboxylate transporter substrate binding protein [Betaproteobacteria bacterium]
MKAYQALGTLLLICAGIFTGNAVGQEYPVRPLRLIVPFAPGGAVDVIARIISQKLTESWGQQVVVDNRAGAGGNIGMGIAAGASPDGYTLLSVSSSFVLNPSLYSKVPYDPHKSFVPISNIAAAPDVFVLHPSVPLKSLQEVVALARGDAKQRSIATPGIGTPTDLAAELFRISIQLDLVRVPYSGGGPALAAVMGNQVAFGCVSMPAALPHVRSGRVRALAVTSATRSALLPDVPTMAEADFAGQESEGLQGMLAPAGTPKAIVTRISSQILRIMAAAEVKERIAGHGYRIVASTPEQFSAQIRNEIVKWDKVIKSAGIKVD